MRNFHNVVFAWLKMISEKKNGVGVGFGCWKSATTKNIATLQKAAECASPLALLPGTPAPTTLRTTVRMHHAADVVIRVGNVVAGDPKRMEEELLFRATQMSQVLEEILRRPHREPDWDLNE